MKTDDWLPLVGFYFTEKRNDKRQMISLTMRNVKNRLKLSMKPILLYDYVHHHIGRIDAEDFRAGS